MTLVFLIYFFLTYGLFLLFISLLWKKKEKRKVSISELFSLPCTVSKCTSETSEDHFLCGSPITAGEEHRCLAITNDRKVPPLPVLLPSPLKSSLSRFPAGAYALEVTGDFLDPKTSLCHHGSYKGVQTSWVCLHPISCFLFSGLLDLTSKASGPIYLLIYVGHIYWASSVC